MKQKLLENLKHRWKMLTSSAYGEQYKLNAGKAIWQKMDSKLPPTTGKSNQDRVRLKMFKKMFLGLKHSERLSLKMWLSEEIKNLRNGVNDDLPDNKKNDNLRLWQIYSEHLNETIVYP